MFKHTKKHNYNLCMYQYKTKTSRSLLLNHMEQISCTQDISNKAMKSKKKARNLRLLDELHEEQEKGKKKGLWWGKTKRMKKLIWGQITCKICGNFRYNKRTCIWKTSTDWMIPKRENKVVNLFYLFVMWNDNFYSYC